MRALMAAILSQLGYPYYFLQAEEPEGEDGTYICYDFYEYNGLSGDGREARRRVTVTVNIYSRGENEAEEAMEELRALMEENEFTPGGASWDGDAEFPGYIRKTADFYSDIEN